jgi:Ca-activated chloride channel family protein
VPIQFNVGLPTLILLLTGLIGSYVYFWWFTRKSITDMSPGRKRLSLIIRLVVVTLIFLALAGTRWVKKNDTLSVIFLMDASKSVRDDQREQELKFVQEAARGKRRNDTVGVVTYGLDPDMKVQPGNPFALNSVTHHGPTNATDISQAMSFALPLIPRGSAGKFVILSDGNENVNSALAEVPTLTADGVRVDTVALPSSLKKEALVDKMVLPSRVKIGEPFAVKVITNALNAQRGRLTLRRNGEPVGPTREVDIPAGKRVHSFDVHIDKPGFYKFEASLETNPGDDTIMDNNKGLGFVSVRGKPQILYVSPTPDLVPFLQRAMKDQNIDVAYAPPAAMPTTAAAFQQFDSVILSDVPRAAFSQAQMAAIQVSTRDFGIGFGMIGGQNSFGAGGYRNTPIEETLPLSLEIKKQKRLPAVAVVLVIEDLEMPSTVNMSKEAAKALVDLLDPMDELGVLDCNGFGSFTRNPGTSGDANGSWRIPLQHVVDRAAIQSKIDTLEGMGDPPSYDQYLMAAAQRLQSSEAKIKHIIFLGDGDAAYEGMGGGVNATMLKIRNMGITVSTVATAADQAGIGYMAAIARDGGGHSYVADQPNDLPRILLKDQQTISAPPIIEEPFVPRQTPSDDVLTGLGGMPQLLGYNIGTPKPTAGVSLISHRNDPVLSTWRYGLGRSLAFTSDDKNKWAVHWLPWAGYGQFWAQAIRWTMRSFSPSDFQTEVSMEGTRGHIVVRAIDKDGKYVNRLNFHSKVVGPDVDSSKPAPDNPLRQTGPGTYEAWFDAAQICTYLVNVTRDIPGKPSEMTVTGLVVPYSPEYKDLAANDFLMTQLAQAGGGVAATNPSQAFGGNRPGVFSALELYEKLLLLAMLLFPIDVAVRRLALDREDFRRGMAWVRAKTGREPKVRKLGATPELSRLMNVKERALSGVSNGGDGSSLEESVKAEDAVPVAPPIWAAQPTAQRPTAVAPTPTTAPRTQTLRPDSPPAAATPVTPTAPAPVEEAAPQDDTAGMSRLMAAKRRAQQQQKKDED